VVLPLLLAQLADTVILQPELMRLIAIAFIELDGKAASVCYEHLSPLFSAVSDYLEANIRSGSLRNLDSTLLTTALASSAILHPELSKLIHGGSANCADSSQAIQSYTRFWLDMLVRPATSTTPHAA
jgi:hypothetical protein